ncbi:hypothetical protein MARINOS108_11430 [Marinoscillum sp. 108]|nr:hypothetical protein MARINOS108_11430 [Marinoscillum sp. 108]
MAATSSQECALLSASSDKTNEFAAPGKGVLTKYQNRTAFRKRKILRDAPNRKQYHFPAADSW